MSKIPLFKRQGAEVSLNATLPFMRQRPEELLRRLFYIEAVHSLPVSLVKELNENLTETFFEEDEDGNETEVVELDYEYMLFSAPEYQFQKTFEALEKRQPETVSSVFGLDGKPLKFKNPQKTREERQREKNKEENKGGIV